MGSSVALLVRNRWSEPSSKGLTVAEAVMLPEREPFRWSDSTTLVASMSILRSTRQLLPMRSEGKFDLLHNHGKHAFQRVNKSVKLTRETGRILCPLEAVCDCPCGSDQRKRGQAQLGALCQVAWEPRPSKNIASLFCCSKFLEQKIRRDNFDRSDEHKVSNVQARDDIGKMAVIKQNVAGAAD